MPRRDPAKESYWRQLLRQWRHSGLSARDFCAERGLSEASFYGWRRELARRDQQRKAAASTARSRRGPAAAATPAPQDAATPAFVKLTFPAAHPATAAIELVVAERRLLRVRPGFDADLLRQLLRLLEEPSC